MPSLLVSAMAFGVRALAFGFGIMAFGVGAITFGFGVRKAKKMKLERQRQYSSWCNLPGDLIPSIMNRLCYVDQIRFRAVCKGWREAEIPPAFVKPADKLPWNMAMDSLSCYLYSPWHKQKYTIKNSVTKSGIFVNSRVLGSKHGWVLFTKPKAKYFIDEEATLFLYSPFTSKIIQLPNLEMTFHDKGTFTKSPLSPDCEIFVVRTKEVKLCVYTCKVGDTRWTELSKSRDLCGFSFEDDEFEPLAGDIEYVDGTLYCTLEQTVVAAINVARKEWTVFSYPREEGAYPVRDHLIESDGNLLLCYDGKSYDGNLQLPHYGFDIYPIFKLKQSHDDTDWVRVENMGNTSLFLDTYSSYLIPAGDETSELAGTIHSVKCRSRKSHCPKISKIYDWDGIDFKNIWIQPPQ